jgi:hypothetical protein
MKRLALTLCLVFLGFTAEAGFLDDVVEETRSMRTSSHSDGDRTYFSGGSLSIRSKNVSINPISITPPSIEVGCNGIDIVNGSFSIIEDPLSSAQMMWDQLTSPNTAAYVTYSIATKMLSPELTSTIEEAMDYVTKLNNLQLDGCAIANSGIQMVTDSEYRAKQAVRAKNAMGLVNAGKAKNYDEAAKPESEVSKSEMQAVKEAAIKDTNIKDYLNNGGSLLNFVLKEWKGGTATSGGTFSFPDKTDIDAIRAIYGDVKYVPNVKDGDSIEYIPPCTGYDLFYIAEMGVKKRAYDAECLLATEDALKIAKFVEEGLDQLEKLYKKDASVNKTEAEKFYVFIDKTSAGLYFYEAAGVKGLLSVYRKYIEQIAKIEVAHLFVDIYYRDTMEKVLNFANEAKKAEEYGEIVRSFSLGYIERNRENNLRYKSQKDEFLNNSNKEMNRVFTNARGELLAHKDGKLYDPITGRIGTQILVGGK